MANKTENFEKTLNPFKKQFGNAFSPVFVKVKYEDGKLSITGVEAPLKSGNCRGSCGQIGMGYETLEALKGLKYTEGWNEHLFRHLLEVWGEWHLNDLCAECEHQRKLIPQIKKEKGEDFFRASNYDNILKIPMFKSCSRCHYKYGSAWKIKDVPEEALRFLRELPDSKIIPVWV